MKNFGTNLFLRNRFSNHKKFSPKDFDENFWYKLVFEETILQLLKIFDQIICDEKFRQEPDFEEIILRP